MPKKEYIIQTKVWLYPGMAGWHFASVPKKESEKITADFSKKKRGWGSLKVRATIGKTVWESSIFPDKKSGTYLFPLKLSVRRAEGIAAGDTIKLGFRILV